MNETITNNEEQEVDTTKKDNNLNNDLYRINPNKIFKYDENSIVNLLLENQSLEDFVSKNMKRYFYGTWYSLFFNNIKVINKILIFKQRDLNFLNKYKFPIIRYSPNIKRVKNLLFDITPIIKNIENRYSVTNKSFDQIFQYLYTPQRKNILMYSFTDLNPLPDFIDSSIYPILRKIYYYKNNLDNLTLPDDFYIHIFYKNKHMFIHVVKDGDWSKIQYIINYVKNIFKKFPVKNKNNTILNISKEIVRQDIKNDLSDTNNIEVEDDNQKYDTHVDKVYNIIKDTKVTVDNNEDIPLQQKINTVKDDVVKKIIPSTIKSKDVNYSFNKIIKSENILNADKVNNISNVLPINDNDIDNKAIVTNQYRQYEYQNAKQTLNNMLDSYKFSDTGFEILESNIITEVNVKSKNIQDSKLSTLSMKLKFKDGKIYDLKAYLPDLKDDSTLRLMGNDYYIVNQFYHLPITFPKKGEGKFISHTSSMVMELLVTKCMLTVNGNRLPYSLIYSYIFGLKNLMDSYNLKYEISDQRKSNYSIQISKDKYINVLNDTLTDEQNLILSSLFPYKLYDFNFTNEILSKKWYEELITEVTGNPYTSESINNTFKIALDTRTLEILRSKHQPTNISDILKYMFENVSKGYFTSRNDLRDMRIRSYESILQIIADKIKKEATNYNRGLKYGTSNIKFTIDKNDFVKEIISSPSVNLLYRGNPVDEIHQTQKITYSGYKGIPEDTVSLLIKGLHETYYGTVDPINTPEGGSTGVNQELTLDPSIISKYGTVIPHKVGSDVNIFSIGSSLSPFISHDEPTRGIFIGNQIKQAVGLKESQIPMVLTGYEALVPHLNSNNFAIKSPCNGKVIDVNSKTITIECINKEKIKLDLSSKFTKSTIGIGTNINFTPNVKENQKVVKDQILADNEFMKDGILSLGRNMLTALLFWKGNNYEDGIVISEAIASHLTSTHYTDLLIYLDEQSKLFNLDIEKGQKVKSGHVFAEGSNTKLYELIESGLIDDSDLILNGPKFKLLAPYDCKVEDYQIYINSKNISYDIKNILNKYKVDFSDDSYVYKNNVLKGVFINIKISFELPIELGDKLTNRHGGKGIVTLIEKEENMPILPDGRKIELIYNPLGIINRTNVGQVYELYCGEISYQIQKRIAKANSKNEIIKLLNSIRNIDTIGMVNRIINLIQKDDKNIINYIKKHSFPIVIPPFKESNYETILKIMDVLNIPNRYKLFLNEFDDHVLSPVGYMYFYKLHHQASVKIHARSIGQYIQTTGQPTQGKKKEGGLRVGEFDIYSLISYDANNIIKELFSFGSDNSYIKQKMYRQIVDTGHTNLSELKNDNSKSKIYMKALFKSIMIDLSDENEEYKEGEINNELK